MPPKSHRLSRFLFALAKKQGVVSRFPEFSLSISIPVPPVPYSRFSIVTSSSFHKRAVIRNAFRRRVYPVLSRIKPGFDVILFPSPKMLKLNHAQLFSQINSALSALSLL